MPKYLIQASFTAEGAKGLLAEGGSKRRDASVKAVKSLGGKLEACYFAFGKFDAILLIELPDNVSAAAVSLAVNSTGLINTRTTVLLTPAEVDKAVKKTVSYRAPGQ